ncbi:MAG TPA: hypothetical protein VGQ91_14880 [Ideonella sp.]|nr:hypothetical protein [Ideonella sp.]
MSQVLKLSLAAAAALVLSFSAQAGSDAAGSHSRKMSPEAIGTSHKLQKTYFDTDSTSTPLSVGSNDIGTVLTVNCANTAGCTIAGNMNAQLAAAATENAAAICLVVDGSSVSCPFNAIIRPGSGFQVMNYQTFTSVALGNHTVQMRVFTSVATNLFRWNKEFKLYKP